MANQSVPRHSSKLLHCSHNFPAQVGPNLNCNKSGCFGGVASVPFFGICSSFSLLLFVEGLDIFFSFPRAVKGDLSLSSFPRDFYEVKVLLLFHLLNYVKHVHGSKIKLHAKYKKKKVKSSLVLVAHGLVPCHVKQITCSV